MSRFSFIREDGSQVAYGYDRPNSEYFIQLFAAGDIVFDVASYYPVVAHPKYPERKTWRNHELLDLFKEMGVPELHCGQLAMDLPITGDAIGATTMFP